MKINNDKVHARLSPSSSARWITCPGSVRLIESLNIKDKPSKFAAEGTVAHEIHELCLVDNTKAEKYIGKTFEADGFKFKVNQNMVDAVQQSLDYINERIADAYAGGMRVEILVEVKASLKYAGIPGLDGGTSDVVLIFWDKEYPECDEHIHSIEVIDYKHGQGVAVEAKENTQALSYGLGVIMDPRFNGQGIPGGVSITISQPRAHHPDGRIRTWDVTKDYILNWAEDNLFPAALETKNPEAILVPSDKGCRFCGASGQCPKLYEKTQEVAMLDFDTIEDEVVLPRIETLTYEQKSLIIEHAATIRSFIVSVENQVKEEMNHGGKCYEDKFKLVRKTTRRKFIDDATDELVSPLLDHLDHKDIFEEKPRSTSEIERRLKKAIGNKIAKEIMSDITIKPEGELVVAPLSDKRKAQQSTVISDFNGL